MIKSAAAWIVSSVGFGVLVGVLVGVSVGVLVGVSVGVLVGVLVGVSVGVLVEENRGFSGGNGGGLVLLVDRGFSEKWRFCG